MMLQKLVDGVYVDLTPEELAEREQAIAVRDANQAILDKKLHNDAVDARLVELDIKRIRPATSISMAIVNNQTPSQDDVDKLNELTAAIDALRETRLK